MESKKYSKIYLYKDNCPIQVDSGIYDYMYQISLEFQQENDYQHLVFDENDGSRLRVVLDFIKFFNNNCKPNLETEQYVKILERLLIELKKGYLKDNDIHVGVKDYEYDLQQEYIKLFVESDFTLSQCINDSDGDSDKLGITKSKLLMLASQGTVGLFGVFGGQGVTDNYFEEIKEYYNTYRPLVYPFVKEASTYLKNIFKAIDQEISIEKELNILEWLEQKEPVPDSQFFSQVSVSFPLIGLLQLISYMVLYKSLSSTPGCISGYFKGFVGHSQGSIAAVAVASSTDEKSYIFNSLKALGILSILGNVVQKRLRDDAFDTGFPIIDKKIFLGKPSNMLLVDKISIQELKLLTASLNKGLKPEKKNYVSIRNGIKSFVVSGPKNSLLLLLRKMNELYTRQNKNLKTDSSSLRRSHIPSSMFLNIMAPFHSEHLRKYVEEMVRFTKVYNCEFSNEELLIPVYSSFDGRSLVTCKNLTRTLIEEICAKKLDWIKATELKDITHIVDFGPGGISGIGSLTANNKLGTGVQVIFASTNKIIPEGTKTLVDLLNNDPNSVTYSQNWEKEFGPKIVQNKYTGSLMLDTRMTRLLGKPHIMVAGMTPSTIGSDFVSSVLNSGYHIELAGGGHYSEASLREEVEKIRRNIGPGDGITVNVIFLNARMASLQLPLLNRMRLEGAPIDGVCISAGVPSLETSTELIEGMIQCGIKHISFKPGNAESIRQVVLVAKNNPKMNIILQWTGGRGGGHHSSEDFHQPILETYAEIRMCENVVLVAGSGFGGDKDTLPYITGDWSMAYERPRMPFDGILLGSRMMVAKECPTSYKVKQLIVDTPGVPDIKWADTYNGPAGGIISVISELGQPIHMIANRAVMLWDELDKTIFSLPVEERKKILKQKKEYIIGRLNKDYQRPWFGRKENGDVCDLEEMTYSEVIFRMVDLMFDHKNDKWIHSSYMDVFEDFLRRVEERFSKPNQSSVLHSRNQILNPMMATSVITESYKDCGYVHILLQDIHYFLDICQISGRKPVPFIPILDENLDSWFKKDSLWQSEYLDSVVGQDAQKVCILQGPVAVSYANVVDEPVSDILNGINQSHIRSLLNTMYEGDETRVPEIEYSVEIGVNTTKTLPGTIECVSMANKKTFKLLQDDTDRLPTSDEWYSVLCGGKQSWLSALLFSRSIVRGEDVTENNIRSTLAPIPKTTTTIHFDDSGYPTELCVENEHHFKSIKILYECKDKTITITMNDKPNANTYSVFFKFSYKPETPYALIHEIVNERNSRVSEFYKQLWVHHPEQYTMHVDETGERTVIQNSVIVSPKDVAKFCQVVDNTSHQYVYNNIEGYSYIPMDFVFSILWGAICTASHNCADANMLDIVHYSVKLESLCDYQLLKTSDNLSATARLLSVTNSPMGKMTTSEGILMKDGVPHYKVVTSSLFRGKFNDYQNTFSIKDETKAKISLNTEEDLKVLQSKEWLIAGENYNRLVQVGSVLVFNLVSSVRYKGIKEFSSVKTVGSVEVLSQNTLPVEVGCVDYESGHAYGNPVLAYLERNGEPFDEPQYFEDGGYSAIPKDLRHLAISHTRISNKEFALVTADLNPIHTNIFFANLSGLPGTIVHGMWTSAATRRVVETCAAEGHPERVAVYEVNFLDMVLPGDTLETKLTHVGMRNGRKIIKVETFTSIGNKVLEGVAEINPPKTAYLFTGQGSQVVNMGVDLYNGSEAVKEIWNSVDKYMDDLYGFSLLEIIRLNPSEKTIYFGGSRGKEIRTRYINMRYEITNKQGESEYISIFPEINERSESYTFRSPTGLLNATQFTQPSIMLFAMAASQDMLNNNLVHKDLVFAGHSLGEFCALLVMGGMVKVETMIELVFYRGLAMQLSVERNKEGASKYGMVAFNPSRIASKFMEMMFEKVVDMIKEKRPGLMEIVNYNIYNWQYVIAGELVLLDIFSQVTDVLFYQKEQLNGIFKKSHDTESEDIVDTEMMQEFSAFVEKTICQIIAKSDKKYNASNGYISLTRSKCTIPIPGIDVPFHSSFLLSGVPLMRQFLHKSITKENVVVEQLERRYIPNVTGKMFAVSKAYFEMVYSATHSPHLREVIDHWDESHLADRHEKQRLGHILLVELLSYQFASPVQWIETQNTIFGDCNIEQAIEVGPSSVLVGMATRTIHAKFKDQDDLEGIQRTILHCISDKEFIYHANRQNESNEPQESNASLPISSKKLSTDKQSEAAGTQTSTSRPSEQVTKPAETATPTATPADLHYSPALENSSGDGNISQGVAAQIEDVKITAREIITSIVAQKLKKGYTDISDSKSIKDLVNGKSAMQNEIISDLQKEFQNQLPDKAEEMPLVELFGQLNNSSGGLGPFSSVRVSKLVNSKMPGGFTIPKIKEMLNKKYGLGPLRADCLLLLGTTFEPENRLANEKDMNSWLEIVANQYAKIFGIQYSQKSETSNVGTSGVTIDSKEFNEYVSHYKKLLSSQQIAISDFLGRDVSNESLTTLDDIEASYRKAKHQLDIWESEYDERYSDGIKPIFTSLKCRIFDSYWNWVEWQLERVFYDTLNLTTDVKAGDLDSEKPYFVNKSTPRLVASIKYKIKLLESNKLVNLHNHYNIVQLKLFLSDLLESCEMAVDKSPLYYGIMQYYGPKTTISNKGDIEYNEVQREGINDIIDYINSMTFGIDTGDRFDEQNEQHLLTEELLHKLSAALNLPEKLTSDDLEKISNEIRNVKNKTDGFKTKIRTLNNVEKTHIKSGLLFEDYVKFADSMIYKDRLPFLHLRRRHRYDTFNYDKASTLYYLGALLDISFNGITFASKNVLVTGCGKGSIGIEIVKALLMGGANVIATTSKFSYSAAKRFEKLYKKYGSKGSSLTLLPFNQSSQQDVNSLVDYIFLPKKSRGLGMILDAVVPFGAMSEVGKDITNLDSVSEVAHRTMMVNILRLIGRVKINKEKYGIKMRSTMVFVPLSLNHGGFGGDGLYAESKIGLETLFDKWAAESWGEYISIAGVVVGWARGTGLMNQNNILAEGMEKQGGKTFSTKEVAFNVLGLLHPEIRRLCDERPIYADISGGFGFILEFSKKTFMIRQDLINQSLIQKQIKYETSFDFKTTEGENVEDIYKQVEIKQRSNLRIDFPKLRDYSELKEKFGVGEMLNLDKTVVVVGFGEVGPFGSAETRWDMEIHDEYSNDGCIMLGWIMGFIRYHRGTLPNGQRYQGWVDAKSGDPVEDTKIKLIYGKLITEHSGLRRVDPELLEGYDPDCRKVIREVVIHEKMKPIKTTEEEARYFKLKHKETVEIWKGSGDDWFVRFLAGTKIFLPKASKFEWFVSGLVPKFWTAERYGLPLEICKRIDDLTAFCLVATNDAFMRAGIEDPYELFKFVHVSEIGNSIGSAVGGSKLAFTTLKRRYNSEYIEGGVFDECYCSSMANWVNKYILPSSGPFVVPSGTCATGAVSIDIAVQSLITGKAKIMLSGGHDDVTEECSMEFANMQATANSTTDFACGRTAKEMSRPFTSTRHGFMDSQGSAVQILMTAATALEIGLPIYGIIAYSGTSSDKVGRSFPAPGKGLITSVRESPRSIINPLLNISYRRRQLKKRLEEVDSWFSNQLNTLITDFTGHSSKSLSLNDLNEINITSPQKISELNAKLVFLNDQYSRLKKNARDYWSYDFWLKNPSISPIRGSLAAFGLTADDIDFVNCHGTSTAANDNNESEVLASQFKKLGRTYGNVCPAVSQKGLMGHTKGGAAAFAINGVLQSILTGVIPGSHNADNISNEFEDHFYVYHPSRSIKKPFIKACLMKSLGFGQIGAEILVLNPDYLFSSISEDKYLEYKSKVSKRNMYANKIFFNTMTTTKLYLTEKQRLYDESNEVSILLNPNARAEYSVEFDTFRISAEQNTSNRITSIVTPSHVYATIKSLTANAVEQDTRAPASITHTQIPKSQPQPQPQPQPHQAISTPTFTPRPNTEIIHIKSISVDDSEFIQTHFTELEISYCKSRPSPRASFAGKLAAKTAVLNSIYDYLEKICKVSSPESSPSLGCIKKLSNSDVEIRAVPTEQGGSGAPKVVLNQPISAYLKEHGIVNVVVSISHTDDSAIACALVVT